MLNRKLASECFNENRNNFSDFQDTPEKFNLYNGLENMALMIETLLAKVENLENQVHSLRNDLTQG